MLMTLFQFSDELRWINTLLGVGSLFGESGTSTDPGSAREL
jgi:hypothetical protein